MEQYIIVFSMKGCPYCETMKDQLTEHKIEFLERDIFEHSDEYDLFVKSVGGNEYVPAFMIIETDGVKTETQLFAPERNFEKVDDGVKIIKESVEKFKSFF